MAREGWDPRMEAEAAVAVEGGRGGGGRTPAEGLGGLGKGAAAVAALEAEQEEAIWGGGLGMAGREVAQTAAAAEAAKEAEVKVVACKGPARLGRPLSALRL